jgi:hypothetical protein
LLRAWYHGWRSFSKRGSRGRLGMVYASLNNGIQVTGFRF